MSWRHCPTRVVIFKIRQPAMKVRPMAIMVIPGARLEWPTEPDTFFRDILAILTSVKRYGFVAFLEDGKLRWLYSFYGNSFRYWTFTSVLAKRSLQGAKGLKLASWADLRWPCFPYCFRFFPDNEVGAKLQERNSDPQLFVFRRHPRMDLFVIFHESRGAA